VEFVGRKRVAGALHCSQTKGQKHGTGEDHTHTHTNSDSNKNKNVDNRDCVRCEGSREASGIVVPYV
jgi:hypothetical protein